MSGDKRIKAFNQREKRGHVNRDGYKQSNNLIKNA